MTRRPEAGPPPPPYFNLDPERAATRIGQPVDTARFAKAAAFAARGREDLARKGYAPDGRKRLRKLKYPKATTEAIGQLVYLHMRFHGFGENQWTDSAVRRYVTDAGDLLPRLHKLVRADCTTRNAKKARRLQRTYDQLEERIEEIGRKEDLARVRPDLDGNEIMQILGLQPGPEVGQAWSYLKELRLEHGPLEREEAIAKLREWWDSKQ